MSIMQHVTLHFLNVGHGDCTFIDPPSGHLTMIDVNNSKSLRVDDEVGLARSMGMSVDAFRRNALIKFGLRTPADHYRALLVDPYDYFHTHFRGRSVFRYIQTHPDMDHMSGLCQFFWWNKIPILNFWDAVTKKQQTRATFDESRYDWNDWLTYRQLRQGSGPDDTTLTVLRLKPGAAGDFYRQDGIKILGPSTPTLDAANRSERWNDASYILRLDYGGRKVILPGDAEENAWEAVLTEQDERVLACDILKAAHHGRQSGYYQPALAAMDPSLVICSVGNRPETDATDEYSSYGSEVLTTRRDGSITVTLWADGEVWVQNARGDRLTKAELPALR